MPHTDHHLVVDIGGTNTRIGWANGPNVLRDTIKRYRNADHSGIAEILRSYLNGKHFNGAVCIDMAGPVHDNRGVLTNLDWEVSRENVTEATNASHVCVLNDLQAQGYAVPHLKGDSLVPVMSRGAKVDFDAGKAACLVVNVGTGLNAAQVFHLDGRTLVPPAEAGHITLTAVTDEERAFMDWLEETHPEPGMEDVLSGRGFERLYAWLAFQQNQPGKKAADIMAGAAGDPIADKAIRMFCAFMGRYAGDLALITLPFSGVYLCGGVSGHFRPYLATHGFEQAFHAKGRFSDFMQQFPVSLIADDYAALTGCAAHLTEILWHR